MRGNRRSVSASGVLALTDDQGQAIVRGLDRFDRLSLREGAAALMLWPKNADRHAALQELVDALAAEPEEGEGLRIKAADWAVWLASDEAKSLQAIHPEGLHDAPLAFESALLGHKRTLLAARLEYPALHYRLWMESLVDIADPDLKTALELLMAVSSICDLIIERGELGSTKWPDHQLPGAAIVAPSDEEYERLRAALRIEVKEPDVLRLLEPLSQAQGSPDPWQPLLSMSESLLLVADPWQLSLAGLVHAAARAARSPRFDEVVGRLTQSALGVVVNAAEEMDWAIEHAEDDHLVARVDLDCRVLIGVSAITLDPTQFGEEAQSDGGHLAAAWEQTASRAQSLGVTHSLLALIGDGRGITVDRDHPYLEAERESDPWVLGIGELQTMGEALRQDPLAVPAALRSIRRPPWPENYDLLDAVGGVRQWEEQSPEDLLEPSPSDGTEYMLRCARLKAMRHPAILPDLSRWVEVSRWEGAGEAPMFRQRDSDEFALLVRASGRYIWVTCKGSFERRFDLLPVIATALAFWLDPLCKAGLMLGSTLSGQVLAHFHLELDQRPGPQLAFGPMEKGIRMILGQGFVASFCRGNNDADRTLTGAVLSWAEQVGDPAPPGVLEKVLPPGYGTFAIWPDPEAPANEPRLEILPSVEARIRKEIELGLAGSRVEATEVAIASDEALEPVLEDLSRTLEEAIQSKIQSFQGEALRELVALHERAAFQGASESILLPALSAWRAVEGQPLLLEEDARRELVLRVLIERAAASPPAGDEPLSLRNANWLRAATELQLKLRATLDAVHFEEAGGQVAVSSLLGIQVSLGGELPEATHALFEQVLATAPDAMVAQHDDWWGGDPVLDPDPIIDAPIELEGHWRELDLVMRGEWGVGFEQLVRILRALSNIALEQPDCVACSPPGILKRELEERTRVSAEAVSAAVDRLTLGPCPDFDTFSEPHQPGRANRERSYLRCPLVALSDGDLAWSGLHCLKAGEFLVGLIQSGRLRGSQSLSKLVMWISQDLDHSFEQEILKEVERCGWRGKIRLTHLGGTQLRRSRTELIGDIDVLAWAEERQEIWLLDAKRLAPSVEPGPMLREGETFEKHADSHDERLRWVRARLPLLAREIGAEDVSDWQVRAALVLDRPLTGPHLRRLSMPVWTRWGLAAELGPPGADSPDSKTIRT